MLARLFLHGDLFRELTISKPRRQIRVPIIDRFDMTFALAGAGVSPIDRPSVRMLVFNLTGESKDVVTYLCKGNLCE